MHQLHFHPHRCTTAKEHTILLGQCNSITETNQRLMVSENIPAEDMKLKKYFLPEKEHMQ